MRLLNTIGVIAVLLLVTVKGQWVVQNHTIINTTYVGYPGYAAPNPQGLPPGNVIRNNTGYHPPGFINRYPEYVRNSTGFNAIKRNGNDMLVGTPGPNDVILHQEWYTKPARWLQIREKRIEFPLYPTTRKYRITAIHALDIAKGPGGHANIVAGGIGYPYVTVRLSSDRSCGFSFNLKIFGQ